MLRRHDPVTFGKRSLPQYWSRSGSANIRRCSCEGGTEPGRRAQHILDATVLQQVEGLRHRVLERPLPGEERPGQFGVSDRIDDLRKVGNHVSGAEDLSGRKEDETHAATHWRGCATCVRGRPRETSGTPPSRASP